MTADMQHSLAQNCNEDVLEEVLQNVSFQDLASTALLCRSWLHASRALLYRHIRFNTSLPSAALFELTMHSSPHLRTLIRHLVLSHRSSGKDHLLDWIAMLPESGLLSVKFDWMPLEPNAMTLLQFPAIRNSREIVVAHPYFLLQGPDRLTDILSYPSLQSLVLLLPKSLPIHLSHPLALTRLSLVIMTDHRPQLLGDMLRAITPPLLHLDLMLNTIQPETVPWLSSVLAGHLSTLRHFTLKTLDGKETVPVMDILVASLASIGDLSCGIGTYTARLFELLPASLRSLTLASRDEGVFPVAELCTAVSRLRAGGAALSQVTIDRRPSYASYRHFDALSRLCATSGISFEIAKLRLAEQFS